MTLEGARRALAGSHGGLSRDAELLERLLRIRAQLAEVREELKSDADDLVGDPAGEPMPDLFSALHESGGGEMPAACEEPEEEPAACPGAADAFAETGADEDLEEEMDEGSDKVPERLLAKPEFAEEHTEAEDGPAAAGEPGISGPVTEAASAEAAEEIPGEAPGGIAAEATEEHLDTVFEEDLSEETDGKCSEEDVAGVLTEEAPVEEAPAEAVSAEEVAPSGELSTDGVKPLRMQRRRRERDLEAEPKELFAFYEQSLF